MVPEIANIFVHQSQSMYLSYYQKLESVGGWYIKTEMSVMFSEGNKCKKICIYESEDGCG